MEFNSSSSSLAYFAYCSNSKAAFFISIAFAITNFSLLLPLSLFILYLGYQRWRQQRSFASTSHSDIFTYHFAAMELIFVLGEAFYCCGLHFGYIELMLLGYYVISIFYPGQISLHILTCMERYLAVIHPVTYLWLRQSGGVRIRNMSIGCAWLLYCGWIGLEVLYYPNIPYIPILFFLVLALVLVSFCSLYVLCVLIRPGPGEMGKKRERVDQSKRRAFNTITAITGMLWLFFLGVCFCVALQNSHLLSDSDGCLLLASGSWFSVPSSLVLPLMFLHRARKLVCCSYSNG